MDHWNCKKEWPICLYDFTYKNRLCNYFAFKVEGDLTRLINPNYFDFRRPDWRDPWIDLNDTSRFTMMTSYQQKDLIIERSPHLCHNHPDFQPKFKKMF